MLILAAVNKLNWELIKMLKTFTLEVSLLDFVWSAD